MHIVKCKIAHSFLLCISTPLAMPDVPQEALSRLLNSPPYAGSVAQQRDWLRQVMACLQVRGQPFARGAGLAASTVNRFLSEDSRHRLRPKTLDALIDHAQDLSGFAMPQGLSETEGSWHNNPKVTVIPFYASINSAQEGAHSCSSGAVVPFNRDFLLDLGPTSLSNLVVIQATSDSMQPSIGPRDRILVDKGVTTPDRDGLYLLEVQGAQMIRRLTLDPAGAGVSIRTDNPAYASVEEVSPERLTVVGLLLWVGRRL